MEELTGSTTDWILRMPENAVIIFWYGPMETCTHRNVWILILTYLPRNVAILLATGYCMISDRLQYDTLICVRCNAEKNGLQRYKKT